MVVLSHAPELVDGNRAREILTRLFHTLSFGEFGVDGFFLISGYLITKSFVTSPDVLNYLFKRVARIYPAFLVATIVSIVVFAPLSGTQLSALGVRDWVHVVGNALTLQPPSVQAFPGTHYPILNGAMWTIAYEFRCYLLIAILGLLGILRHREFVLAGTAVALLMLAAKVPTPIPVSDIFYGNPPEAIRMTAAFLTGAVFYLYRDVILYRAGYAVFAAVVLLASMFGPRLAEPILCVFGGYLIFWLALVARQSIFSRITTDNDISYGLYLYTWPIQSALVYFRPGISPWLMFAVSLLLAAACGYLSWILLERRIQRRVHRAASGQIEVPTTPVPSPAGAVV
jgi:peptidoglycan/LPS O-acetylase OafA/YrhL